MEKHRRPPAASSRRPWQSRSWRWTSLTARTSLGFLTTWRFAPRTHESTSVMLSRSLTRKGSPGSRSETPFLLPLRKVRDMPMRSSAKVSSAGKTWSGWSSRAVTICLITMRLGTLMPCSLRASTMDLQTESWSVLSGTLRSLSQARPAVSMWIFVPSGSVISCFAVDCSHALRQACAEHSIIIAGCGHCEWIISVPCGAPW